MNFLISKTPLMFLTQSFWRDEAFSFLMANQNLYQILIGTAKDFSPPIYYVFLHYWMMVFGSSEVVLRLVSVIFFYLTVFVFDHFLVDVLKIKSKWRFAYLLLIAINPFLIYFASEARMYTMTVFFVTLSWYGLLIGKKKIHLIASTLSLYTHYFTILALLSQVIYVLITKKNNSKIKTFVWIAIFFIPWVIFTFINHGSTDGTFWITEPTFRTIRLTPGIILTGFENTLSNYFVSLYALTLLTYGAILIALKNIFNKGIKKESFLYLLLWALLPALIAIAVSFIKPIYLPRYFIFSVTGITLLLIFALEQVKPLLRICFYGLIVFFLLQYNLVQVEHRQKGDVRSIVKKINKTITANDFIYVESELDFHTIQYYFDPSRVFIYRKTYQEIPQYVGKVLIPSDRIVSTLPSFPRKAYLIHSDLTYDVQSMN